MVVNSSTRAKDVKPTGILGLRSTEKKRGIRLKKAERKYLAYRQQVEKAVSLFLDLEVERTWAEIARELGLSVPGLHNLTKSDEFNEIYNEFFSELGHDPRLKVSQQALADMVPLAVRTLREILSDPSATTASRMKAVEMVFKMAGVEQVKPRESDKSELQNFLLGKGVNIEQVNVQLPPSLQRAEKMLASPPPEIVEGEVEEHEDADPYDEPD